jgi:protoheme IX farnesyltransferase
VSYVCIYTYYKRETEYATLIGTIPGATPIAAGYAAAAGRLDTAAVLLFVIMVIWQLPHFYAIAMFRREEYAAAGIPVLSVTRGMRVSKVYILWSIVAFAAAAGILGLYGYAGFTYFVVMALVSGYWLWVAGQTYRSGVNDARWARQIFGASLLVLLVFCVMLSLDAWLP